MLTRRWAQLIVCATFALILLGGVVHTRGASLACPDWPLCFGLVFPEMVGGVLLEHSHRLLASAVGVLSFGLLALVWRDRTARGFVAFGVALVVGQGLLGGLTVIYRLPPPISIAHLGTSMLFLAWGTLCAQRLGAQAPALPRGGVELPSAAQRGQIGWALGIVYFQLLLGATVRHTHSSLSCGTEALTCQGAMLPLTGPQWLQTSHRVYAVVAMLLVVWLTLPTLRWAKRVGERSVRRAVIFAHILLFFQLVLGALTLKTGVHLHVVVTHLALAALLWMDLVALWGRLSLLVPASQSTSFEPVPHAG